MLSAHQTVHVRRAGPGGEVVHFIVQHHTGSGRHEARTERIVDSQCGRDRVTLPVDDRIVGGVPAVGFRRRRRCELAAGQRAIGPHRRREPGGIIERQQPRQGDRHEVRIAKVTIPVVIGAAHRLDDQVLLRSRGLGVQIEQRQNVHGLQQHGAAAGRRHRGDLQIAIAAFQRLPLDGPVLVEVPPHPVTPGVAHFTHHAIGQRTAVEAISPSIRKQAERIGQILLHQPEAGSRHAAVIQKDRRRSRPAPDRPLPHPEQSDIRLTDRKAMIGIADRRTERSSQRKPSVPRGQMRQCGRHARNGCRQRPVDGPIGNRVSLPIEVHLAGRRQRCAFPAIEHDVAASRPV